MPSNSKEIRKLRCPKCEAPMVRVLHSETEVDRCSRCQGIWFDANEVESLREVDGAAVIDTGDERVGAALDDQKSVTCPVCDVPMKRTSDSLRPHIWYERCGTCNGAFLDAGEFRDLTNRDLFDLFGRLLTGG